MPLLLLIAFLAMPLIEIYVILQVGQVIGGWTTLLVLVGDSLFGAWIVTREGRRTWAALRDAMTAGQWPADEVLQGAMVLVSGALLLTPGFVTDAIGLVLVLPITRIPLARWVRSTFTPAPLRVVGFGWDRMGSRDAAAGTEGKVMDVEIVSIERDDPESLS